jgi:hypothetical protein
MNNIKELFSSFRFQQLLVVAILQALQLFNVLDSVQAQGLTDIISTLLIGSVAVGTIDKFNTSKNKATISIPTTGTSEVRAAVNKTSKKK